MRIAFITPEFVTEPSYSGGLANYLGRVTVALARQNHDVHVFTRSKQAGQVDFQGVTVHQVLPLWDRHMMLDHVDPLVPRVLYNPYQDLKAAWCLKKCWKTVHQEKAFDLVQVANVMAVGLFFRGERSVPIVTRLSSYRPFWDRAAGIKETLGVKARWYMERLAITGCRHLYAPTYFVAKQVEKGYGIDRVDVLETPFFSEEAVLDTALFEQKLAGKDYILYFGRMTQMKGVHILAQALPKVLDQYPQIVAVFVGGEGIAPDGRTMQHYVAEQLKAFHDRTLFIKSIRHDKLYPIVKEATAIVLPSLIDNLPNTCLEAMGLGKVVVATTGSCFEQLIEHELSGILVEPNDSDSLAEGIVQALQMSESSRQSMEAKATESINRLRPEKAIPKLIDYYQTLAIAKV